MLEKTPGGWLLARLGESVHYLWLGANVAFPFLTFTTCRHRPVVASPVAAVSNIWMLQLFALV